MARGPNEKKPDQQDARDQHHPCCASCDTQENTNKGTVVAQSQSVYPVALILWNMLMAQTNRPTVVAGGLMASKSSTDSSGPCCSLGPPITLASRRETVDSCYAFDSCTSPAAAMTHFTFALSAGTPEGGGSRLSVTPSAQRKGHSNGARRSMVRYHGE